MKFSVIIPVRECPTPLLGSTLESIVSQTHADFETIIVLAHKSLATQEFIARYEKDFFKTIDTEEKQLDKLIQLGLDASSGDYVHVLLPGQYYLFPSALDVVSEFIADELQPDVVMSGWMHVGQVFFETRVPNLLKKGFYPITLQNYWVKRSLFTDVGGFNADYDYRGKFDFFCRLYKKNYHWRTLKRVLTDSHRLISEPKAPIKESQEMLTIINKHFGPIAALGWWCTQNQIAFLKTLFRKLKKAFLARG